MGSHQPCTHAHTPCHRQARRTWDRHGRRTVGTGRRISPLRPRRALGGTRWKPRGGVPRGDSRVPGRSLSGPHGCRDGHGRLRERAGRSRHHPRAVDRRRTDRRRWTRSARLRDGAGRGRRECACAEAPSHAVDLARFVADDIADPASVDAAGRRPAAARTAATGESGVRVPGRRGGRERHGGPRAEPVRVHVVGRAGSGRPHARRTAVRARARTGNGEGVGRGGHQSVSSVRAAARGGPRRRRGRRPPSSGRAR